MYNKNIDKIIRRLIFKDRCNVDEIFQRLKKYYFIEINKNVKKAIYYYYNTILIEKININSG